LGPMLVLGEEEDDENETSFSMAPDGSILDKTSGFTIKSFAKAPVIEVFPEKRIGSGAGGVVVHGKLRESDKKLAIKIVHWEGKGKRDQLRKDLAGLLSIKPNPHLVDFHGVYCDKGQIYIALELMDFGSLDTLRDLVSNTTDPYDFPEPLLASIARQSLAGLKALEKAKAMHRDIKPANILINTSGQVKLTDFGLLKLVEQTSDLSSLNTYVGTHVYMSPERVMGDEYSSDADIWSFGMVIYELATGKHPVPPTASPVMIYDILCKKPEPRLPDNGKFSEPLRDFVAMCLQRDIKKRPSIDTLLRHPFILTWSGFGSWLADKKSKEKAKPK